MPETHHSIGNSSPKTLMSHAAEASDEFKFGDESS